jgi:flagellar biosynthetic protein FliR
LFEFINYGTEQLQIFLMLLIRATGLFLAAPIFGHTSLPSQVKVGLIILLSVVTLPTLPAIHMTPITSHWELAALALRELLVGVLIGFVYRLLFHAAEFAGMLAGYQVGLAVSQAFDPTSGEQVSVIGRFWLMMATLIFLALNGHHMIIQAFHQSYQLVGPGEMVATGASGEYVIKLSAYVFVLAIKIVAPVLVTLVLMDVALGTVAKMMPSMNIFIVGFPLKIGMGLLVVALSLPAFAYVLEKSTHYLNDAVYGLLASMGKA